MRRLHHGRECGRAPGTTKAPPCMRWRGLAASCCPAVTDRSVSAGPAGRAPRAAFRDCSRHALVERVARCGLPVPIARVQLLRGAGAPRGPPVPIARVQLLRGARSSRSASPDCSGPAPTESGCPPTWPRSLGTRQHGTASPRPASIAQDSSSRGQLRRATGRLLACPHLGTHHLCRKPAANRGLPLLAAPRESPPGPVPVPGDKEISSGRSPCPTRAFRQHFPRVSASTGQSTGGGRLSPGNPELSTASSTGTSTDTLRTVHHLDTIRPPPKRTGYRRTR